MYKNQSHLSFFFFAKSISGGLNPRNWAKTVRLSHTSMKVSLLRRISFYSQQNRLLSPSSFFQLASPTHSRLSFYSSETSDSSRNPKKDFSNDDANAISNEGNMEEKKKKERKKERKKFLHFKALFGCYYLVKMKEIQKLFTFQFRFLYFIWIKLMGLSLILIWVEILFYLLCSLIYYFHFCFVFFFFHLHIGLKS